MKNKIAAVVLSAAMVTGLTAAPVFAEDAGLVKAGLLNVRKGPSTNYDVIDQLIDGTQVVILDDTGIGWYEIYSEYGVAFVCADYININGVVDAPSYYYSGKKSSSEISYSYVDNDSYYDTASSTEYSYTTSEGTAAEESYVEESYASYTSDTSYEDTYTEDTSYEETYEDTSYEETYEDASYEETYEDTYTEDASNEETYEDASYEETYEDTSYEESYEDSYTEDTSYTEETSSWDGEVLTASKGVVYGPSGKETYYNLDMSGVISIMRSLGYTGEYWVRDDGVKMLGDYVMIAANLELRPRGSLVETSLGTGIVCDTGGFAASNPTQIDIAVSW